MYINTGTLYKHVHIYIIRKAKTTSKYIIIHRLSLSYAMWLVYKADNARKPVCGRRRFASELNPPMNVASFKQRVNIGSYIQ